MPFSKPEILIPILHPEVPLEALERLLSSQQIQLVMRLDGRTSVRGLAHLLSRSLVDVSLEVQGMVEKGLLQIFQRNKSDGKLEQILWKSTPPQKEFFDLWDTKDSDEYTRPELRRVSSSPQQIQERQSDETSPDVRSGFSMHLPPSQGTEEQLPTVMYGKQPHSNVSSNLANMGTSPSQTHNPVGVPKGALQHPASDPRSFSPRQPNPSDNRTPAYGTQLGRDSQSNPLKGYHSPPPPSSSEIYPAMVTTPSHNAMESHSFYSPTTPPPGRRTPPPSHPPPSAVPQHNSHSAASLELELEQEDPSEWNQESVRGKYKTEESLPIPNFEKENFEYLNSLDDKDMHKTLDQDAQELNEKIKSDSHKD